MWVVPEKPSIAPVDSLATHNMVPYRHTLICFLLRGLLQRNTVLYNIIFLYQKDRRKDKIKHTETDREMRKP
jgi:hypothetical protein